MVWIIEKNIMVPYVIMSFNVYFLFSYISQIIFHGRFKSIGNDVIFAIQFMGSKKLSVFLNILAVHHLTHWGPDKWPPFRRQYFQMHFLEWRHVNFDYHFTKVCSCGPKQYSNSGLVNGLVPTRRQAITWTNDGQFTWRIYATWPQRVNSPSAVISQCLKLLSLLHLLRSVYFMLSVYGAVFTGAMLRRRHT